MQAILAQCDGLPRLDFAKGEVLLREGERSGKLLVLATGILKVSRGETDVALVSEPGAILGEMSVLLDLPHTASVRAATRSSVHVIEHASSFLQSHPEIALPIATLLARRLLNATTYLADLKEQFRDREDHLGMVDEVLDSLTHLQDEDFPPVEELPPEP
jgi:CRP-like cAMP-binding protein